MTKKERKLKKAYTDFCLAIDLLSDEDKEKIRRHKIAIDYIFVKALKRLKSE